MVNEHLHILHLPPTTETEKVNKVSEERYKNLIIELQEQNITNYTLWEGEYDPINTKRVIHAGHHKIVQYAKDKSLPSIIIAEDDIKFTSKNSWKYFLSQIPQSFDLFFGIIYNGEIIENRVMNGFSGGCTLYVVNQRFYDKFLEQPIDTHIDRQLGNLCHSHEFYVIPQYCVIQRGGYSMNLKREMWYDAYLTDKVLYGQ